MNWLLFALAGSIAQLIDGALGMGFGLTSSTLLLTLGTSAAVASAASKLFATHPPIHERIAALRAMEANPQQ